MMVVADFVKYLVHAPVQYCVQITQDIALEGA